MGPSRVTPGTPEALFHSGAILTDFHSQMVSGLLFLALVPWAGQPVLRWGPLPPHGGTSTSEISLQILNCHTMASASLFLLPVSLWLIYILSFKNLVQVAFRQF